MCSNYENCPICDNIVKPEYGIKCSGICKRKYHSRCMDISAEQVKAIKNMEGLRWFCTGCLPLLDFTVNLNNDLSEFKKTVREELGNFKKALDINEMKKSENNKIELSYAKVVAGEAIVIKPKSKQENIKTEEAIKKHLKPAALEVGITQMKNVKDGGILIKCKTKEEVEKIKKAAEKKLGKNYQVNIPNQRKPCIKVLDIDEEFDNDGLINAIKKQNANIRHNDMDLKVMVFKKMRTRYQAIIECDPTTFKNIMKEGSLSIGYLSCRVYEYIKLFRCFKCGGFNHKADECNSDITCVNCGSNQHTKKECDSEVKCANCVSANKTLGLDIDNRHSIFDIAKCSILQKKMNNERQKIMTNDVEG